MKLLILSPDYSKRVNWGHQHLRDALLKEVNSSVQYGEDCTYKGSTYIPDICEEVAEVISYPDVILMENFKNMSKFTGGAEADCLKVFIVCDYYDDARGNYKFYNKLLNENEVDIAIANTPDSLSNLVQQKCKGNLRKELKCVWVSQGVDTSIFKPRSLEKIYDVMAVFGLVSYVYPNRPNVQKLVEGLVNVRSLIGDWSSGIKHFAYAEAISRSKIFVNCNGVNNQVLMKYFEVMSSGTLLLTDCPRSFEDYGFVLGEHFIVYRSLHELENLIYHYLHNDDMREKIAKQGMDFVRSNYSTKKVASQIVNVIGGSL